MDSQSPVSLPGEGMSVLMQAGYLPPTEEYSTVFRHFPGINAHPPWGARGTFHFEARIYENGSLIAAAGTGTCDETGSLFLDVGEAAEKCGHPVKGMFVVEYHHAKEIPVELYAFHIHKRTGTYISCNITPFIGDRLYPEAHSDQMENTLFWPGMVSGTDNEPYIIVVNPYEVKMGFQIHRIGGGGRTDRTGMLHLKPKCAEEFPLARLFPADAEGRLEMDERVSFCISSQYKLVAYVMFKSGPQQVMSMVDHLHAFCLV